MKKVLMLVLVVGVLSGCSIRLVDFTVVSSRNVSLNVDKAQGKKVKGEKSYFLGFGWNIKDALDIALDSAGPGYDLLVDGVVRYGDYLFVATITVEGTAVNSKAMKSEMGEVGFNNWLNGKKLTYDKQAEVVYSKNKK